MSDDPRLCAQPGVDPDLWFKYPGSVKTRIAKTICMQCPLYWDCQQYALQEGIEYGVWGGLDQKDRERYWHKAGRKPTNFLDDIDAAIAPLLRQRWEAEKIEAERAEFEDEWEDLPA